MFVFAEAMAFGMVLLIGLGVTLLLAVLALVFRHRGLGLTALLTAVFTVVVIASLKVQAATYARDHPQRTPPPTIGRTWTGSAELALAVAAFEPEGPLAECRKATGVVTSYAVVIDDAGRLAEQPLRVSVFALEDAQPLVTVQAGEQGGSEPWAEWSGPGELENTWLSGRVTFTGLTLLNSRGEWPDSVAGRLSWACDPASETQGSPG
jgi:hypothetical protein